MGFFKKLFNREKKQSNLDSSDRRSTGVDPTDSPSLIKAFDRYGREIHIPKKEWKDNILFDNLEMVRDNPDKLYAMLVGALEDGFASDIIPYAEQLRRIDPVASRGAIILGIVYMENGRLDDAEQVLRKFISIHGEDGVVLTNLAKIYSLRGDARKAESILWHALELDPNQDNGFGWYIALQQERGGETSVLDAYRRIASLPGSWRAQIWLAREHLEKKNLHSAEALYKTALDNAGTPVPPDLLMQMSGDLGNNGYLADIIRLIEPQFDPSHHGLQVGNNLIKANFDLGRLDAAKAILEQLYSYKRSDWQETLSYWSNKLDNARIKSEADKDLDQVSISLLPITGPVWMQDNSPFSNHSPLKSDHATNIVFIGGIALTPDNNEKLKAKQSDGPGILSRALPLLFAERIQLTSDAAGIALIPWINDRGFCVFGLPQSDQDLCSMFDSDVKQPEFLAGVTVDATQERWGLRVRLIRRIDGALLGAANEKAESVNPGPSVEQLFITTKELLRKHAGIKTLATPSWYQIPKEQELSDYLLRLEQQLAVYCTRMGGGLYGERKIVAGALHLSLRMPINPTVRMLFAQTLRQMQTVRPGVLPEFKEKIALLQKEHPLGGDVGRQIGKTIAQIVESI